MTLRARSPAWFALALLLLAVCLGAATLQTQFADLSGHWWQAILSPDDDQIRQIVMHYTFAPRLLVALLGGAALALAGCLMQQVLRNPLASPATLGVTSGAQLALVIATLWAPSWMLAGREWIALLGGIAATLLVFALSWKRRLAPMVVVLSGMVVSLYFSAINSALLLFHQESLSGLFIWGAGALAQDNWHDTQFLLLRLFIVVLLALLLLRPLSLLDLEEDGARSLGISLRKLRFAGLGLGIFITACVVSAIGLIGFIGLASPAIARLSGARTLPQRLVWSMILGALLLAVTDLAVQQLAPFTASLLPTGAMTAALGAPLLLWLLPRLKVGGSRPTPSTGLTLPRLAHPRHRLWVLGAMTLIACALALVVGFMLDSHSKYLSLAGIDDLALIVDWRLPRVATAAAAGLMLAVAGTLLQRMTGNPMASPEVLGISAGVAIGVIALMLLPLGIAPLSGSVMGFSGATVALLVLIVCNRRSGFAPERLLLTGIAISSLLDAMRAIVLASEDPRAQQLLSWLGGSTYYASLTSSAWILVIAIMLFALALPLQRWLTLLPLGAPTARALGMDVDRSRLVLLALVALLTVAATLVIGPLSFIGLMAPHMARLMGFHGARHQLLGAGLLGMLVMVTADWLGRNLFFPYQLPAGLIAALIGGVYFMWGLRRL
ncbi:Fe(3+)-hydroxamate ABC transporter permease FhuB [Salinicola sp. LHM]|jgi:iron complex transport system permease protein|uniref:Fe(3+)-hydroxamate ABC transporter permease FhuB n=1 Tax=Salinicola sp. LHM TaxID=3065298 RepID=UPI002ACD245C|nr:Fe(3+)-hydroxamate ABC transporter permease FhuB [Salinicola sp. LHM]WQH34430.1 Fe(3+)-hydroxamate ABC transporter permease FhuB [Salinicola sp. LHM]